MTTPQASKKRKRTEQGLFEFSLTQPDIIRNAGQKLFELKKTLQNMSEQLDPVKKEADLLSKSILRFLQKEHQEHLKLQDLGVELWVISKDKKPSKNMDIVKEVLFELYPSIDFDLLDQGVEEKIAQKVEKSISLEVREQITIMKSL